MYRKIATCNYCGTRAVLVLAPGRHELSCPACGAPLHEMKAMPQRAESVKKSSPAPVMEKPRKTRRAGFESRSCDTRRKGEYKARKKRKSLRRKIWGEVWDIVEDLFD
ncbi:MAG: hypothetical protein ACQEVT_13300 [Pseudomonadota bacterium]|uniref:hypothetical protein n=1 Tax=Roseovarius TaxID=74030 RepID=UPI0022A85062|nr:hypothetical protein [Roseovarius sp. EGI FJ00037]MCZ0813385.1 hypothetical protein [Roseovarius sp. EGI FJ00037]